MQGRQKFQLAYDELCAWFPYMNSFTQQILSALVTYAMETLK